MFLDYKMLRSCAVSKFRISSMGSFLRNSRNSSSLPNGPHEISTPASFRSPPSNAPPLETVNPQEVAQFTALANEWWAPSGQFELLHRMNPVRTEYIVQWSSTFLRSKALEGLKVLDIGCGGGLLSEGLCRLGAHIMGADAGKENIQMALAHAQGDPILKSKMSQGKLSYVHTTAENLLQDNHQFDVVCALEVIEHVENPAYFLEVCSQLVRPEGLIFISTMNRTEVAKFLTITVAETLLKLVPQGTHDANKYIQPRELRTIAERLHLQVLDVEGLWLNPLTKSWTRGSSMLGENHLVNYIACLKK